MEKSIIYPGTFDPMTNGHLDLVRRALKMFDRVVIAVAESRQKKPIFSLEERVNLIKRVLKEESRVEVEGFSGLLVEYAKKKKISVVLRGLRRVADFEYEYHLIGMNRHLDPEMETVFLLPGEDCAYISSAFVREVSALGGDVSAFVPPAVEEALIKVARNGAQSA